MISHNKVCSFVDCLQVIDVLIDVRLEMNQIDHEQQTQIDIYKYLENCLLRFIIEVSNEHKDKSTHEENKEVMKEGMVRSFKIFVKHSVPFVVLVWKSLWKQVFSRLAVKQINGNKRENKWGKVEEIAKNNGELIASR